MKKYIYSSLIHALEALVVGALAVGVAYFFPEHRTEASLVAITVLSGLARFNRVSPASPVPDYVNGE